MPRKEKEEKALWSWRGAPFILEGYGFCLMKIKGRGSCSLPEAFLIKARSNGATGSLAVCVELFGVREALQTLFQTYKWL